MSTEYTRTEFRRSTQKKTERLKYIAWLAKGNIEELTLDLPVHKKSGGSEVHLDITFSMFFPL